MPVSSASMLIDALPADVFAVLASFSWARGVSEIEVPAAIGPGSVFTTRTTWGGFTFEIVMLVETWTAPASFSVRSVGAKRISFSGVYELEQQGSQTLVKMQVETQPHGLMRPFGRIIEAATTIRLRQGCRQLAELIDHQATARPRGVRQPAGWQPS